MNITKKILMSVGILCSFYACQSSPTETQLVEADFPYEMPRVKPNIQLSESMNRVYEQFQSPTPQDNELYSTFQYTALKGLDYHNGDGTVTRRDPSRVIKVGDLYYIYYTKRQTPTTYVGAKLANDTIPSTDWDLCDIWYATSKDGFTWDEQGVAVPRPKAPHQGFRSVSTPDVLVWKGKYYIYYQAFSVMSGKRGDDCPVAVSYSDSPAGPFKAHDEIVIPNGEAGEWDQYSIHDPYPVVFNDQIYFYYKSDYNGKEHLIRSHGLAIGDNPLGPFKKHPQNPVINSGHETQLFRFKDGIAALMAKDGHENNTIQFSQDGVSFKAVSNCNFMPIASGVYDPEAFTGSKNAPGITWGISHFNIMGPNRHSIMLRFDCDLSTSANDPMMKRTNPNYTLDELLSRGLTPKQKKRIIDESQL